MNRLIGWLFGNRLRALSHGESFVRFYPNPGFTFCVGLFHVYWSAYRGFHGGLGRRPQGFVHTVRRKVGR